jgi:L-fucose isomerase-like protein
MSVGSGVSTGAPERQIVTLGVILGNRDFLPDALITEARRDLVKLFGELHITPVWVALDTFGTKAVVKVDRLQRLMRFICRNGFEHHAATNGSHCANAVPEALGNYLGWDVYQHNAMRHNSLHVSCGFRAARRMTNVKTN